MDNKGATAIAPVDATLPWGVYIPPSSRPKTNHESEEPKRCDVNAVEMKNIFNENHEGYVRIMNKRGKMFQCGFSRPVKYDAEVMGVKKRSHDKISTDMLSSCENYMQVDASGAVETDHNSTEPVERPSSEESLHPEEALFLHMRGLLRIESLPADKTICPEQRTCATMSTQELFEKMLPECNVSISVYLAYAHLREQGYILMRYTENRVSLLRTMNAASRTQQGWKSLEAIVPLTSSHTSEDVEAKTPTSDEELDDLMDHKSLSSGHKAEEISSPDAEGNNGFPAIRSVRHSRRKALKLKLVNDVATAPPPCIPCHASNSEEIDMTPLQLSYLAYNPNAHFKRTNPGLPDFGVVIMNYHSHGNKGPTFDTVSTLVSLCQRCDSDPMNTDDTEWSGFPLRIMTVSDAGAVVAFGVTDGDVPIINH
eukprot:CCRYP_012406-RA/>CCRYP_012406-RA protein AED:0.13 eAED:0.13 QI:0/-1/0/1/-1/1/1/0/424